VTLSFTCISFPLSNACACTPEAPVNVRIDRVPGEVWVKTPSASACSAKTVLKSPSPTEYLGNPEANEDTPTPDHVLLVSTATEYGITTTNASASSSGTHTRSEPGARTAKLLAAGVVTLS
jgi:hypothetical protein